MRKLMLSVVLMLAAVAASAQSVFVNGASTAANSATGFLLSSTSVDVGAVAATNLYTVPAGKTCVITQLIVRSASGTFDQATDPVLNIGWGATASNVFASATLTTPTATTMAIPLTVLATQTVGAAADVLKFNVTTAATASTTAVVDVWGYLY